jgi:hypothetical protein
LAVAASHLAAVATGALAFYPTGILVGIVGGISQIVAVRSSRYSAFPRWQQAAVLSISTTCAVSFLAFLLASAGGGSIKDAVLTSVFTFAGAGMLATTIALALTYARRGAA